MKAIGYAFFLTAFAIFGGWLAYAEHWMKIPNTGEYSIFLGTLVGGFAGLVILGISCHLADDDKA